LEFNIPFQHKYGYIRDTRSRVESYPYPVKEGQRYINLNSGRLFVHSHPKGKGIDRQYLQKRLLFQQHAAARGYQVSQSNIYEDTWTDSETAAPTAVQSSIQ